MINFKQLKKLWVKRWAWNRKLEGLNFLFCKNIKLKMVADARRRRSSFIMYVKESVSVNSSMFYYNVCYLPHVL